MAAQKLSLSLSEFNLIRKEECEILQEVKKVLQPIRSLGSKAKEKWKVK
jgi:hypothetical protein